MNPSILKAQISKLIIKLLNQSNYELKDVSVYVHLDQDKEVTVGFTLSDKISSPTATLDYKLFDYYYNPETDVLSVIDLWQYLQIENRMNAYEIAEELYKLFLVGYCEKFVTLNIETSFDNNFDYKKNLFSIEKKRA